MYNKMKLKKDDSRYNWDFLTTDQEVRERKQILYAVIIGILAGGVAAFLAAQTFFLFQ